jgi:hypothetical protein
VRRARGRLFAILSFGLVTGVMIPAPEEDGDSRPYVIRGAAFSTVLKFKAEKRR